MEVPENLKKRRVTVRAASGLAHSFQDEELHRQMTAGAPPLAAATLASSNPLAFLDELDPETNFVFNSTEEEVFALSSVPPPSGAMDASVKFEQAGVPQLLAQEQNALALLHERYSSVIKLVLEIAQLQRVMTLPPSNEIASALQSLHTTARQLIAQSALDAYTLSSATLLSPAIEASLASLVHELYLQAKQMDLYDSELRFAAEGRKSLLASLVVVKQPFPQTVMKQRHVVDSVTVKLLQGTQVAVRASSKVRCSLVMEEPTKTNKQAIVIDADTADMTSDGTATFPDLKFSEGSEQKRLRLVFDVALVANTGEGAQMRSDMTEPLIVLTHQTQWELSEGHLFRHEAFRAVDGSAVNEIAWPRLANCLQRHFLRVTQGARPLSRDDLWYLHSRFQNASRITIQQCDQFWRWFGKVLYKIRHLKFLPFWVKGVIYGFINKAHSNALLERQPSGTFLIRFSEGNAGQFAIAYRKDGQIHHYLMTDEDQKKTFPDFLAERTSFDVLLRVTTEMQTGTSSVTHCAKYVIVEEFQPVKGRKEVIKVTAGYDEFVK